MSSLRPTPPTKPHRMPSLPASVQSQLSQSFLLFDPNHTNSITYHQLKIIMRALGFDIKKSQLVALAKQYDHTESGKITYDDYMAIMKRKYRDRDPIEEVLRGFRLFDEDGRGKIGVAELRRVARDLGENLREEELQAMIDEFDADGDGLISEEEFLAIVRPTLS